MQVLQAAWMPWAATDLSDSSNDSAIYSGIYKRINWFCFSIACQPLMNNYFDLVLGCCAMVCSFARLLLHCYYGQSCCSKSDPLQLFLGRFRSRNRTLA